MKKEVRHLSAAPIIEAVVDIRISPRKFLDFRELQKKFASHLSGYPAFQYRVLVQGNIPLDLDRAKTDQPEPTKLIDAVMFRSDDETKVVQFKSDGLTVSHLEPYKDWPSLREEAEKHWDFYLETVGPAKVSRAGLRYINRMEIKGDRKTSYFLEEAPKLPEALGTQPKSYAFKVEMPKDENGNSCLVTQVLKGNEIAGKSSSLTLDIDAYSEDSTSLASESLWGTFDELRHLKNSMFFNYMTEDGLKLYE